MNSNRDYYIALSVPIAVADGGTGATTPAGARANLGAAASGANSDITSLSGLSTPLSLAQGGTGQVTAALAFAVISPMTTKGDIIGRSTTVPVRVPVGNDYQFLMADSSSTSGMSYADPGGSPTHISSMFEDWVSSTEAGALGWTTAMSGAGSGVSAGGSGAEAFNRTQGTALFTTGTTATGRAAIHLGAGMGVGYTQIKQQWRVFTPVLSTALEEFALTFGLGDTVAGATIAQTNSVAFVYDRTLSTNWICRTTAAGAPTDTITSVPVTNTSYTTHRIEVNAVGTSVAFYIGGSLVATNTTNIPGFVQFVGPLVKLAKSVGLTARTLFTDYFWQQVIWAVAR